MSATWLALIVLLSFGASRLAAHVHIDAALTELNRLIARSPDRPELYLRRAACHEEHANWAAAEADVLRAGSLAPDYPGTTAALARIYSATSRLMRALAVLDRALAANSNDAELLILRARVHGRLGKPADACADYARATALLPNLSPGIYLEWSAHAQDPAESLAVLDAGLTRLGPAIALLDRALDVEIKLERTDAALARLDRLIASSERKEGWLKRRGDLLTNAGRGVEARQAYASALSAIEALPDWLRRSPSTVALTASLTQLTTSP